MGAMLALTGPFGMPAVGRSVVVLMPHPLPLKEVIRCPFNTRAGREMNNVKHARTHTHTHTHTHRVV